MASEQYWTYRRRFFVLTAVSESQRSTRCTASAFIVSCSLLAAVRLSSSEFLQVIVCLVADQGPTSDLKIERLLSVFFCCWDLWAGWWWCSVLAVRVLTHEDWFTRQWSKLGSLPCSDCKTAWSLLCGLFWHIVSSCLLMFHLKTPTCSVKVVFYSPQQFMAQTNTTSALSKCLFTFVAGIFVLKGSECWT